MRAFKDLPYRFFPARPAPVGASVLRWLNRRWYLPFRKRIDRVEVYGDAAVRSFLRPGDRVVFMPNHATHADGPIAIEALRRLGRSSALMAAYDVFLRGRVTAWYMQTLGAFSVDRECCDRRSLSEADSILTEGQFDLTIFPEGHVFLQNDLVTPFSEGAAFLAHAAARKLTGENARIIVIPVAIKASYVDDIRPNLTRRLHALADDLGADLTPQMSPHDALGALGVCALDEHLAKWGVERVDGASLPETIRHAAEAVLAQLHEERGEVVPSDTPLVDRIRRLRRAAHDVLVDPEQVAQQDVARRWADRAMLAWRISSYAGNYVARHPTVDRIAETIEKLEEDHFERFVPPAARRRVLVRFGTPSPLPTGPVPGRLRTRATELTRRVEGLVQEGLDALNELNPHAGGALWTDPIG